MSAFPELHRYCRCQASEAGFLAEVGDIHNYDLKQQIIWLAGLNLKVNSLVSARVRREKAERVLASSSPAVSSRMPMVAKNPESKALEHYFTTRSQNLLKKKHAIIALCGKLIRILFTLGTKQKEYDANDVMGPVRQAQIQLAA
ncbi:hypothetical protein [Paenibacillus sp. OK003]|uniref:hypothetical protein n=1 Tax=Paenibacillus sp. OK003 TaxID=1884380 RepID=UPI0008CE9D8A|nr:hypothetical protein [Paenibacillus sp. OK003]SEL47141.1 hypothetical protein SAMN05518856_111195 [Paenibacillus sp. OK003]